MHEDHARGITEVFEQLYDARWPVARMRLVDDYGADDDRSMAANNTSAYNCRRVAGSADVVGARLRRRHRRQPGAEPLRDRRSGRRRPTVSASRRSTGPRGRRARAASSGPDDVVVRAFARIGWEWGGDWSSAKDYQHFSASGR